MEEFPAEDLSQIYDDRIRIDFSWNSGYQESIPQTSHQPASLMILGKPSFYTREDNVCWLFLSSPT